MGTDLCTVGCKLPNGLTWRLFNMVDVDRPVMGGGMKTVKEAEMNQEAGMITIRGVATYQGQTPPLIIEGAAMTRVPREFAEEWFKQNRMHPAVKNGMVFIAKDGADAQAIAREVAKERTNQEPMAQAGDPRTPKRKPEGLKPGLEIEVGTTA